MRLKFVLMLMGLSAVAAFSQVSNQGPFGFKAGMTREQIIQIVGQSAVISTSKDSVLRLTTAPSPHAAFESYLLAISPKSGVVKIRAIGKDINTNGFGEQLKSAYLDIQKAVTSAYGSPERSFDFLQSGSIWTEGNHWMMGLYKEERTLATFWSPQQHVNHVTSIQLEAVPLSRSVGYISLSYELEGFAEYINSEKAKTNSVF